jgi:long-chain fatty acid transport protein
MSMVRIVAAFAHSLAAVAIVATLVAPPRAAHGAGFLLFEQTGRGLGSAYAGEAALASDPTTVYWNPAGMTLLSGTQFATSGFGVYTRTHFENRGSRFNPSVGGGPIPGDNGGNGGGFALLPTFFLTHQFHERVSVGIGMSAPFGLETDWPRGWVGRYHARLSRLQTINLNPSIAVKLTDWVSLGVGANAQWASATLANNIDLGTLCQERIGAAGLPPSFCINPLGLRPGRVDGYVRVKGNDWAAGWNIGLLFTPREGTRIGLAYRSRIEHTLTGDADFRIPQKAALLQEQSGALIDTAAQASTTLPDRASISLFQALREDLHFLADVTWTNWSLFDELVFEFANPNQPNTVQPENWKDSLRYSMGLVWAIDQMWTLRGGFAYDESPVTSRVDLTPRIPDADRYWLALGVGIKPTTRIRVDLSYAHIFSPQVSTRNLDPTTGNRLIGNFQSAADIFGFQITYDIDWTFSDPLGQPTT